MLKKSNRKRTRTKTGRKFIVIGCDMYALIKGSKGTTYTTGCILLCNGTKDLLEGLASPKSPLLNLQGCHQPPPQVTIEDLCFAFIFFFFFFFSLLGEHSKFVLSHFDGFVTSFVFF